MSGVKVSCLIDTGSTRTILRKSIFDQIPLQHKNRLPRMNVSELSLELADGQPLNCYAHVIMPLKIGNVLVNHPVLVSDIADQAILGLDFLKAHNCQIDVSIHEFNILGKRIQCSGLGDSHLVRRITLDKNHEIGPECQILVWTETGLFPEYCLVQPLPSFEDRYSIKVAACLARGQHGRVPVRLLNTGKIPIKLYKGTVIAILEPIKDEPIELSSEAESVEERTDTVRSVRVTKPRKPSTNNCIESYKIPTHLTELYQGTIAALSASQSREVAALLVQNQSAFASSSEDLGRTSLVEHEIDTGEARPIKQRPRRTPIAFRGEEEKEIQAMLQKGVIRESTTPWSSPVVLVRKKDGTTRFCVDYRRLNEVTRTDSYPLPRMEDCFDSLAGSKFFSTMDLASGYWQIRVKEEHREKTAFVTKSGLYEFVVMPFGLVGAPSTFERCMENVLRHLQWQTCLVYLYDIIVFSRDFPEHLHRLGQVFDRIQAAGLKLKPSKCHLFQKQVAFLGHIVSDEGLTTDPAKIEAVVTWPPPKNVSQVRSYLGFCSYYRRFIPSFSVIASPLFNLTRKGVTFDWNQTCQQAFEELKRCLTTAPIMAYPTDTGEFLLDTDALDTAIGAVLSQQQNELLKTIAYASRSLTKCERKYCVTRKELLAIVNFTQHFRHYLLGRKFRVRSDHQPLRWLFKLRDPSGQVARWLETLSAYDFKLTTGKVKSIIMQMVYPG